MNCRNERGVALVFALIMILIAGILLGVTGTRIYMMKQQQMRSINTRLADANVQNGLAYLPRHGFQDTAFAFDKRQGFKIRTRPFGFYNRVEIQGYADNVTREVELLSGVRAGIPDSIRLELPASPYTLKPGRNLSIQGTVTIAKGTRIKPLPGTKGIEGQLITRNGPAYSKKMLNYQSFISRFGQSFLAPATTLPLSLKTRINLNDNAWKLVGDTFLDPSLCSEIKGPGTLVIAGTLRMEGKIRVRNFVRIIAENVVIGQGVVLDGVLVCANTIHLDGASGTAQFLARKEINVRNSHLNRGTLLTVEGAEVKGRYTGTIHVVQSTVTGSILMPLPEKRTNPQFRCTLQNSGVNGWLYNSGETELTSTIIHGYLFPGLIREPGKYVPDYNKLENIHILKKVGAYFLPDCFRASDPGEVLYVVY